MVNTIRLSFSSKNSRLFIQGHYLSHEAHSFPITEIEVPIRNSSREILAREAFKVNFR